MRKRVALWAFLLVLPVKFLLAQGGCPVNIGFEAGDFSNWKIYKGSVLSTALKPMAETSPDINRHHIFANTSPQVLDRYGKFPVNAPNGSGYSVRLGNALPGGEADEFRYSFKVPAAADQYILTYNFAVVFEKVAHDFLDKPSFSVRVYNVTDDRYLPCVSFDFESPGILPGFLPWTPKPSGADSVYYKPWSSVTVDLSKYAGKEMRLEFLVRDCTDGRHFGYAYLDVKESCGPPITGNIYCQDTGSITLEGPEGYQNYDWYHESDTNTVVGSGRRLTLSPIPPNGTKYIVKTRPFPGSGCADKFSTVIEGVASPLVLNVLPDISVCAVPGLDLSSPALTQGSTPGLTFSYFTDPAALLAVPNFKSVIESGTYYIKGTNPYGCSDIRPINVTILPVPLLQVISPLPVCLPQTVDLTAPAITAGSTAGTQLSYWKDENATIPLADPDEVTATGTYYIKSLNASGCSTVKPVNVQVEPVITWTLTNNSSCSSFNLTDPANFNTNAFYPVFTYWMDAAGTVPMARPDSITISGTYYINVKNLLGCSVFIPVTVNILPKPTIDITEPLPVTFPLTVDLSQTYFSKPAHTYTYWLNQAATQSLADYTAVSTSGTYFIKAVDGNGCWNVQSVRVQILPADPAGVEAPTTFSPNGDGINDIFRVNMSNTIRFNEFRVHNRWGALIYSTHSRQNAEWDGAFNGTVVPSGVYFWIFKGVDTYSNEPVVRSGSVTVIR